MVALGIALFLLVVGTGLLLAGSDWFLDGAGDLARTLGISTLVLGVLLAGAGTQPPGGDFLFHLSGLLNVKKMG